MCCTDYAVAGVDIQEKPKLLSPCNAPLCAANPFLSQKTHQMSFI